ncbi:hypothetical protein ACIPY2_02830 [Paenarthrobacter sp. NPDC089675]|uniref:hypothetical protein n=1 Tax=Paenarthrobacter sp. NPDC089675 TaxID=3364376 RepID=UPI00381E2DEB
MNARRLVIAGIALAVLIAVVAIVFDQLAVRSGQTTAQASNSASPTSGGDGANGSGAGAQSSGSPTSGAPSGTDAPNGGASPSSKPLEVLPPVAATPTGLPEPSSPAPLIKGSLPAPGSATGAVVAGWPSDILGLPAGTTIGTTAISTSGNVMQLTADGVVGKPQQAVIDSFTASLVPHGFWSESAPAADGSRAVRFVRGTDTVTVSVSLTGTGNSRFQLLGNLHSTAE